MPAQHAVDELRARIDRTRDELRALERADHERTMRRLRALACERSVIARHPGLVQGVMSAALTAYREGDHGTAAMAAALVWEWAGFLP